MPLPNKYIKRQFPIGNSLETVLSLQVVGEEQIPQPESNRFHNIRLVCSHRQKPTRNQPESNPIPQHSACMCAPPETNQKPTRFHNIRPVCSHHQKPTRKQPESNQIPQHSVCMCAPPETNQKPTQKFLKELLCEHRRFFCVVTAFIFVQPTKPHSM